MDYQGINPQDLNQMAQMKQVEEMKRQIMSRLLSKEAFERRSLRLFVDSLVRMILGRLVKCRENQNPFARVCGTGEWR